MNREPPFDFSGREVDAAAESYVARLPSKLSNRQELLEALYHQLKFPGYFGFNWDALSDCLRDFHWLDSPTVVLVHSDVPRLPPEELRTYISILAEAIDSWQPHEDHDFRVAFPAAARFKLPWC